MDTQLYFHFKWHYTNPRRLTFPTTVYGQCIHYTAAFTRGLVDQKSRNLFWCKFEHPTFESTGQPINHWTMHKKQLHCQLLANCCHRLEYNVMQCTLSHLANDVAFNSASDSRNGMHGKQTVATSNEINVDKTH